MGRSITFHAWDGGRVYYIINIKKNGKDKATIVKNRERYEVSGLKKSTNGMMVKGRSDIFPLTLQIIYNIIQPSFTISSLGQKQTFYFTLKDCTRFISWIKKDNMPTL